MDNKPGTLIQLAIAVVPNPARIFREFVLKWFATALTYMDDWGRLIFPPFPFSCGSFINFPGQEAVALVTHRWCRVAMGVGEGMPPEETSLLTLFEPEDICMYSQRLVVEDGLPDVLLSVDEKI